MAHKRNIDRKVRPVRYKRNCHRCRNTGTILLSTKDKNGVMRYTRASCNVC